MRSSLTIDPIQLGWRTQLLSCPDIRILAPVLVQWRYGSRLTGQA
jgi:hypothetical protein